MKNIRRQNLKKWTQEEIKSLVDQALSGILKISSPQKIILFGSALGDDFDEESDLDFVLVFPDSVSAKENCKKLNRERPLLSHPIDLLCIDKKSFEEKSQLGGVFFIAKEEGKTVFPAT